MTVKESQDCTAHSIHYRGLESQHAYASSETLQTLWEIWLGDQDQDQLAIFLIEARSCQELRYESTKNGLHKEDNIRFGCFRLSSLNLWASACPTDSIRGLRSS